METGNKPVNKGELAGRVAKRSGDDEKTVYRVLCAYFEEVQVTVETGESITIAGFGCFEGRNRASRIGRNPRSGEQVPVEARRTPVFRAAKSFKERVATAAAQRAPR